MLKSRVKSTAGHNFCSRFILGHNSLEAGKFKTTHFFDVSMVEASRPRPLGGGRALTGMIHNFTFREPFQKVLIELGEIYPENMLNVSGSTPFSVPCLHWLTMLQDASAGAHKEEVQAKEESKKFEAEEGELGDEDANAEEEEGEQEEEEDGDAGENMFHPAPESQPAYHV